MRTRWAVVAIIFVAACFTDAPIATALRSSGLAEHVRDHRWAECIKFFGTAWFAVTAAAGLLVVSLLDQTPVTPVLRYSDEPDPSPQNPALRSTSEPASPDRPPGWRSPVRVLLAAALSGLNVVPKWIVGQARPFKPDGTIVAEPFRLHPFFNGIDGLFHERDLSFPSGHACTAAAIVTAIVLARPRLVWVAMAIALVVGIERVIENAHYADDVIAGWAMGYDCALAARWIVRDSAGPDSITSWPAQQKRNEPQMNTDEHR